LRQHHLCRPDYAPHGTPLAGPPAGESRAAVHAGRRADCSDGRYACTHHLCRPGIATGRGDCARRQSVVSAHGVPPAPEAGMTGHATLIAESLSLHHAGGGDVRNLSFSTTKNTLINLINSNNTNKTTLLQLLTSLSQPDAGRIMLEGIPLATLPERTRARR